MRRIRDYLLAVFFPALSINRRLDAMALNLTRLNAAIAANTDAVNNAVTVINAGGGATPEDQAAIDAGAATLEANNAALQAAIPAPTQP